uniref:Putative collagen type i alpha 1b n=1 Tax=Rhipicephalus pulchellus TaxID=72859 RepID=L7LUY8_RHIPC
MGLPQHQLPQHPHHHAGGTLTMGSGAPQLPHGGMPSHLLPPHQQHPQPHPGVGPCNPLAGAAHMAGGNMAVGGPSPMGGPGMGGPQVLPPGGNMGTSGLHRPPSGPSMPPGGAGCPVPPQGGAGVGGGGLEAQYMQQQSQIFVFTTGMANQAAESVLTGQCPSIIAFHCAQPGTKRILEKHPLKIQQFKQNPAAWLNTLAQMKQRGAQGMPGGPMGPTPGGGAMKVPQTFGPGFCGPPHACGPTHPGGAAWQPQESWGAGPYGPAGMAPQRGPSPAGSRGPQQGHHPQGCGPPNGGCFPAGGGAYPGMGGPGCGGNPAQMNAGVKVPDENLTPQQRQHREEQLAMIRKMQKLLFPDQQVMGNATGPPGQQQQQQTGAPQQPQGGVVPPRPRGPDQFGHCGDHQHEGASMPPQMQQPQQPQPQQQQHFGAGPQGAMMAHPPADWQAQQQQGGMTAQKPYLEDRRRKGAAATTQPQGLFPACGSEFSASGSPSGYVTRPGSCPNPNFNNGTTGPAASSTGNRPSSCAGFNSPGSFSNPPTPSGFPGAPGASPAGPSSSFPTAPGASPGMVFSPGAVAQQQQTAAGSFGGRPPAQCGGGGGQFPGSAPCGSPALQPFSPSVRGSSGSSPPNYGGSGAGGSGSPGTVPPPPRSPALSSRSRRQFAGPRGPAHQTTEGVGQVAVGAQEPSRRHHGVPHLARARVSSRGRRHRTVQGVQWRPVPTHQRRRPLVLAQHPRRPTLVPGSSRIRLAAVGWPTPAPAVCRQHH